MTACSATAYRSLPFQGRAGVEMVLLTNNPSGDASKTHPHPNPPLEGEGATHGTRANP